MTAAGYLAKGKQWNLIDALNYKQINDFNPYYTL